MKNTLASNGLLIIPFTLALLFGSLIFIAFRTNLTPEINFAISFDLLITVPVVYFLLIRKTKIPKITVVPLTILGLVIGYLILPKENQNYLDLFKAYVLPIVELGVLTFIVLKIRNIRKAFKNLAIPGNSFYDTALLASEKILPKQVSGIFAMEIATIYYTFFYWKAKQGGNSEFTYHKTSTSTSLFIAFGIIILIESVTLHYFAAKWNPIFAWALTIISLYTLLQFIGWVKSLSDRPHLIKNGNLHLRFGIVRETVIPLDQIKSIVKDTSDQEINKSVKTFSLLGKLDPHNTILELHEVGEIRTLYGMKSSYKKLLFYTDNPDALISEIESSKNNKA